MLSREQEPCTLKIKKTLMNNMNAWGKFQEFILSLTIEEYMSIRRDILAIQKQLIEKARKDKHLNK